jgi:hypothetical protein
MLATRRIVRTILVGLALSAFIQCSSHAQGSGHPAREFEGNRNSLSLQMVGTVANGSLEGTSNDRRLFLFGVAYNRLLKAKRHVEVTFTSQVIPLALLREPYFIHTNIQAVRSFSPMTDMRSNYGAGASPVGIKVSFLPGKAVRPFVGFQGGFLYFSRIVVVACVAVQLHR